MLGSIFIQWKFQKPNLTWAQHKWCLPFSWLRYAFAVIFKETEEQPLEMALEAGWKQNSKDGAEQNKRPWGS